MKDLTIEDANEKLESGMLKIQKICQEEGLTIHSCNILILTLHFNNMHGVRETVEREIETTPF